MLEINYCMCMVPILIAHYFQVYLLGGLLLYIYIQNCWCMKADNMQKSLKYVFMLLHNINIITLLCVRMLQGEALNSAKKILLLLLSHLPQKCLFNILTFGASKQHVHNRQQYITVHDIVYLCCLVTSLLQLHTVESC